ncbi:hotdog family protein [Jatrophihabitans fulvus]
MTGADTSPSAADELNAALGTLIPVVKGIGLEFVDCRPGHVGARVPFEGNGNHFGAVYAGVIFTVAEVLGGAIHYSTFDPATHFPIVRRLEVDFLSPGTGPLTAVAELSDDEIARIRAESAGGNKSRYELTAQVLGEDGTVVATTRGDYRLHPFAQ